MSHDMTDVMVVLGSFFFLFCPQATTSKVDPNFPCLSSEEALALTEPTSKQYVASAGVT